MKFFWSWQSDIDDKINRYFIRDCIQEVLTELNKENAGSVVDESVRELDQDTMGVTGSPHVFDTILKKIKESDYFIADITPIAKTKGLEKKKAKKVMNPNVALELGYALSIHGDERIITIFNESLGTIPGDLPFDLSHKRWPLSYNLTSANSTQERESIKKEFKSKLKVALRDCVRKDQEVQGSATKAIFVTDEYEKKKQKGIYFKEGESLCTITQGSINKPENYYFDEKAPYLFFNILVDNEKLIKKADLTRLLFRDSNFKVWPLYEAPDNTPVPNNYGVIVPSFSRMKNQKAGNYLSSFTQVIQTGSSFTFSSGLVANENVSLDYIHAYVSKVANELIENITVECEFSNFQLSIGMVNVAGKHILLPELVGKRWSEPIRGPISKDFFSSEEYKDKQLTKEIVILFLDEFIEKVLDEFAISTIDRDFAFRRGIKTS